MLLGKIQDLTPIVRNDVQWINLKTLCLSAQIETNNSSDRLNTAFCI